MPLQSAFSNQNSTFLLEGRLFMTVHSRFIAVVAIAAVGTTGLALAQGAGTPPAQGQTPAAQAPTPPPEGRGAAGQRGAGQQGRQGGGGRRGGFTQFTRELAPQDVIVRGKSLYEANCATCHAADLRGTDKGPSVLRSGVTFNDQHGELIAAAVNKHTPALTVVNADIVAIAEYLHSVQATMGGQGSPPGRNPTDVKLNVLVGDPRAGENEFSARCAGCHSGNNHPLNGIATKYSDPRAL